jgi:molybdopterin/thiamine biosynthesis adenylyltransferase
MCYPHTTFIRKINLEYDNGEKKMENINHSKYSRQVLFWPKGSVSQSLLHSKTVTLIGAGALGTVIANHLVRAGIGELRLVDRDVVEESNLQRQMLYDERDVLNKSPKAISASEKLQRINSEVTIVPYVQDINPSTIEDIVLGSHLIMDATDNMETRFLLNDISVKYSIPWIYGGAIRSRGMTMTIIPGITPCFRCLFHGSFEQHGETCDTVGVLGPLVHIVASYQTAEALKLLVEHDPSVQKDFIQLDIWYNDFDVMPLSNSTNETCPCCKMKQFDYLNQQTNETLYSQLCGRDSVQICPSIKQDINFDVWEKRWGALGKVERTPFLLRLLYQTYRLTLFQDGRLLIQGTNNFTEAKQIYTKIIGL